MPAPLELTVWHWAGFVVAVLVFLALDLGVFHREAHVVKFREALGWTVLWFLLAFVFAFILAPALFPGWDDDETVEFLTGYIIELSLSMDNVFVIALIFVYFAVPLEYQHRVLFWGILGALLMRGAMIWLGTELIVRFHWVLYLFGVFLVLTGSRMIFARDAAVHPERNPLVRMIRKLFPVSQVFDGQRFLTRMDGRKALTPLALVLLMVETTDLIFAVDSIPAIFAVTQKPFVVFTSNVFAILGLRSLFFVLARAMNYFRYLKCGLSVVLIFIGAKMLFTPWYTISNRVSLSVVAGIILAAILFSVIRARHKPGSKSPPLA